MRSRAKKPTVRGQKRKAPSRALLRSYIAITEDHGDLHTVWQTCLANDSPGRTCPNALRCDCVRVSLPGGESATLLCEVHSYDTWEAALACADALNEPLTFALADGSARGKLDAQYGRVDQARASSERAMRAYWAGFLGCLPDDPRVTARLPLRPGDAGWPTEDDVPF